MGWYSTSTAHICGGMLGDGAVGQPSDVRNAGLMANSVPNTPSGGLEHSGAAPSCVVVSVTSRVDEGVGVGISVGIVVGVAVDVPVGKGVGVWVGGMGVSDGRVVAVRNGYAVLVGRFTICLGDSPEHAGSPSMMRSSNTR